MRRLALAFVIAFFGMLPVAFAQPEGSPEGGAGFPGADVNEEEAQHSIANWWTWDYKSHHLPPPFGYALINFCVFAAIMYKLGAKPLTTFVRERHSGIRHSLDEASRLFKEAQAKLDEYQKKVANVDQEITSLLDGLRKEAESEKARILAAAEADSARLKADATRQIAAEIERARTELRRGVVEAAIRASETILRRELRADDQQRMADRYVRDLDVAPPGKGAA